MPGLSQTLEFWSILLLPWLLDIFGDQGIQATVFGALLWGIAMGIAAMRPRTRDEALRTKLGWVLAFLSGSWLTYWALSFAEAPRRPFLAPEVLKWLTWIHAGLLTAGLGLVILLLFSALLWLVQDRLLRRSSWERRGRRGTLPSLEALGALCERTVQMAFSSWGLGLFLAILTAMWRWQPGPMSDISSRAWWMDTKVVASALLWLALAIAFQLSLSASHGGRWLYRTYFGISFIFVVAFSWFMLGHPSAVHEPLSWFRIR